MTTPDRFPVPVRSAVKSVRNNWCEIDRDAYPRPVPVVRFVQCDVSLRPFLFLLFLFFTGLHTDRAGARITWTKEQVNLFVNIILIVVSFQLLVFVMLPRRIVYLLVIIAVASGTDVLKLTDNTFDTLLAKKQLALVNFHTAKYVTRRSSRPSRQS